MPQTKVVGTIEIALERSGVSLRNARRSGGANFSIDTQTWQDLLLAVKRGDFDDVKVTEHA